MLQMGKMYLLRSPVQSHPKSQRNQKELDRKLPNGHLLLYELGICRHLVLRTQVVQNGPEAPGVQFRSAAQMVQELLLAVS